MPQNSSALQVAVDNMVSEMLPPHDSESSPPPCHPQHARFAFHTHQLKKGLRFQNSIILVSMGANAQVFNYNHDPETLLFNNSS